jgi:hypothetical protein
MAICKICQNEFIEERYEAGYDYCLDEVCNRIGILKKGILVKELRSEEVTANELEQLYLQFMQN